MRRHKPFKSQKKYKGPNLYSIDQDLIKRLCQKSKMLFGVKWRWRKLLAKAIHLNPNATAEELEKNFDIIIERSKPKQETKDNERSDSHEQLGDDSGRKSENGSTENTKPSGKEVRSGEAENGPSTAGGTE